MSKYVSIPGRTLPPCLWENIQELMYTEDYHILECGIGLLPTLQPPALLHRSVVCEQRGHGKFRTTSPDLPRPSVGSALGSVSIKPWVRQLPRSPNGADPQLGLYHRRNFPRRASPV